MADPYNDQSEQARSKLEVKESNPWAKSFRRTAVVLAIVAAAAITTSHYVPYNIPFLGHGPDYLSAEQAQDRADLFNAVGTITLQPVEISEMSSAVSNMQLDDSAKKALLADLERYQQTQTLQPSTSSQPSIPNNSIAQPSPSAAAPASQLASPVPIPNVAAAAAEKDQSSATGLVWLTLWDTDDEDGDTVRIDSNGYSRTVILAKQPVTFAVPIPTNGIINVTGVRDGEGGGITVGVASGSNNAVLPIMSVGQVLGLHVEVK